MQMRATRMGLLALIALVAIGCSESQPEQTTPSSVTGTGNVTVEGVVVAVEDLVPVDGGVTIDIAMESDERARLLFGSLFTSPPPDEATLELYEIVRRVEVGDFVRASGEQTDYGIKIDDLAILKR